MLTNLILFTDKCLISVTINVHAHALHHITKHNTSISREDDEKRTDVINADCKDECKKQKIWKDWLKDINFYKVYFFLL